MRVEFNVQQSAPERLVCEASIIIDEGQLAGMKLVGLAIWRDPHGDAYVTFPNRSFGERGDRRFFDYLRAQDGTAAAVSRVKAWIMNEFKNWERAEQRKTLSPREVPL